MKKAIEASVLLIILILVLTVVINFSHSESRVAYNMNNLMEYNAFTATCGQNPPLQEADNKRGVSFLTNMTHLYTSETTVKADS